jgi:hypothetical protein
MRNALSFSVFIFCYAKVRCPPPRQGFAWIVTVPAKLLRSLHRFPASLHTIPLLEMSPTSFDRTAACVICFRGQAGSATAEPALSPILCSQ